MVCFFGFVWVLSAITHSSYQEILGVIFSFITELVYFIVTFFFL